MQKKYTDSKESNSEEEEEEGEDEEKKDKKRYANASNKNNGKCSLNEHKEIEAIYLIKNIIYICTINVKNFIPYYLKIIINII